MEKIVPSILAADFSRLGSQLEELEQAGVDSIHIDVMDGRFVPNISIGFPIIRSLRSHTGMQFDVHLMIQNPEEYIQVAADAGADSITVHAEAGVHLHRAIEKICQSGCKAGVAINPATSLDVLEYVAQDLDVVLLMTVDPGFGGQEFIPWMMDKIPRCREFLIQRGCKARIELDGGITLDNAPACIKAGADILVSGSAIFRGSIGENVAAFQRAMRLG